MDQGQDVSDFSTRVEIANVVALGEFVLDIDGPSEDLVVSEIPVLGANLPNDYIEIFL